MTDAAAVSQPGSPDGCEPTTGRDPAHATPSDLARSARDWALAMTRQPSVTGTPDEVAFGPWLAARLSASPGFGPRCQAWTFPVAPGDGRHCVAMLIRGEGRATVVLTGHYDTVSTDDYAGLAGSALEPDNIKALLVEQLASATTPAELRARADLASGDFLPGRGLLDMKAGLAAGLAVAERFGSDPSPRGNILFLAVPDEEAASAGARKAATELPAIAQSHGLDLVAAINLDAIADDGDGAEGRIVALGTIGKLLPTAFVVGRATHSGFPHAGINAATLAAAIATRVEWASELTDGGVGPATPPSLLSLRDGKVGYDVTTPATAFAAFNVLTVKMSPETVLQTFGALCAAAVAGVIGDLRVRADAFRSGPGAIETLGAVPVLRFEQLEAAARQRNPAGVEAAGRDCGGLALPLPERCRAATERLWSLSGLVGPAVVIGFGSIPYLPSQLSGSSAAARLADAARSAVAEVGARHGTSIRCDPVFAGISDMSFLGEADETAIGVIGRNTPLWDEVVRWPADGGTAGIPIVNAGPWGRDYHTPLERLHTPYGFEVVPDLVDTIVRQVLGGPTPPTRPVSSP